MVRKNGGDLQGWSVILSGTGRVDDNHDSNWMIQGHHVNSVIRTKLKKRSREDVVSIGTLRIPNDLYADIDATLEK